MIEARLKTLMNYTKKELAEHCLCLEHNNEVLREGLDQQYKNGIAMLKSVEAYNKGYKELIDSVNRELRGGK